MSFLDLHTETLLSRRSFLKGGMTLSLSAMVSVSAVKPVLAMPSDGAHSVTFKNAHTGEVFSGVYRVGDRYLPQAFERINYVMRDFRRNEVFPMDPRAIDIIAAVHRNTGSSAPYSIISGYRSPHTNAMLRSHSKGVAKKSLHMSGMAIDVRLGDISPKHIRQIATRMQTGGVGYYPRQGFVHLDSGAFRTW